MPEARINKSARVFRQQLLAGERAAASDIIRYYGNAWQSIQVEFEGVLKKISEAQKAGEDVSPAWLFQADRLHKLQLQIESSMNAFSGQAEATIVQEQKDAIQMAQYHAQNGVLAAMGEPPREGLYVPWSRLPEEQTRDLIGTLQDGSPLRDLLDSFGDQAKKDAGQTLVNGLAMGKGTREIARDMRQVMGIPLVRALRISRTETLRSYRETTRRAYQANPDVVKGWIWHATIDGRTCPMCWAMHGTEHKLEERLNDHPNGRCAMVPKTITWEDITGIPSPLETSAEVPPGEEVFKQQTEAIQRKVLGNAGYDAWKAGKITLQDFVGETPFDKKWGKHRYARSLKDILGAKAPAAPAPPPKPKTLKDYGITSAPPAPAPVPAPAPAPVKPPAPPAPVASPSLTAIPNTITQQEFYSLRRENSARHLRKEISDEEYRRIDRALFDAYVRGKRGVVAPAAPTPPPPTPAPAQAGFPDDLLGNLVEVRSLGGSTGAMLMEDPRTGARYVVKRGASPEHIRSEFLADRVYQTLGIDVPQARLYEEGGVPVKVAQFIPDTQSLADLRISDPAKARAAEARLREGFAADALLGNWDVIGTGADNILIGADGKVWRIDNGGALDFRAQGALKKDGLGKHPGELWSMRDKARGGDGPAVFGSLGWNDISVQMLDVAGHQDQILKLIPDTDKKLTSAMTNRLDWFNRLGTSSVAMGKDGWKETYVDKFSERRVNLWSRGVFDTMSRRLRAGLPGWEYQLKDSLGRAFDALRGGDSVSSRLRDYVNSYGGNWDAIVNWADSQANSSWDEAPRALKAWTLEQRGIGESEASNRKRFWWPSSDGPARSANVLSRMRSMYGADTYDASFTTLHAATMEVLSRMEMPGNDPSAGVIRLTRSESTSVLSQWGFDPTRARARAKSLGTQPRGPLESTSLTNAVFASYNEITVQEVPHYRVVGAYLFDTRGSGSGMFMGDAENEFVTILDGLPTHWVRKDVDSNGFVVDNMSRYWKFAFGARTP